MTCQHESAVIHTARMNQWNDFLQQHVTACASCAEIMNVAQIMQSLAASPGSSSMPEASRLWCLALLEQKQAEASRARRIAAVAGTAAYALPLLGLAVWLYWNWPAVEIQAGTGLWSRLWSSALLTAAELLMGRTSGLYSLTATAGLTLALAVAVILQPLLSED